MRCKQPTGAGLELQAAQQRRVAAAAQRRREAAAAQAESPLGIFEPLEVPMMALVILMRLPCTGLCLILSNILKGLTLTSNLVAISLQQPNLRLACSREI